MKIKLVLLLTLVSGVWGKQKFKDYWRKFCGLSDCYEELGLEANATKAQIRRAYRDLSLKFHPDKNPGDTVAAEKFRKVALANEVLTNDEQRKKYDYYKENPAEYFQLYGSYLEYAYAPKSSIITVFLFLLVFASFIHYALQWNHYWRVVAILKSAAIRRLPLTGGGSVLALDLRRQADAILKNEATSGKQQKKSKLTKQEEKQRLDAILTKLINQIPEEDAPPDLIKPAFTEILFFKVFAFPFTYASVIITFFQIQLKKMQNQELNESEKQYLIERYLPNGAASWEALSDQDQDDLLAKNCHIRSNYNDWVKANGAKLTASSSLTTSASPAAKSLSAKNKRELRQRRKNPNPSFTMED